MMTASPGDILSIAVLSEVRRVSYRLEEGGRDRTGLRVDFVIVGERIKTVRASGVQRWILNAGTYDVSMPLYTLAMFSCKCSRMAGYLDPVTAAMPSLST